MLFTNISLAQNNTAEESIESSWLKILPTFVQNFIKNLTKISQEKVAPKVEEEIGDILNKPTDSGVRETFFNKIKNRLRAWSEEINQFFKVDIGTAFQKIMNLFISLFNKGVEFIKNLFSE